MYRDRSSWLSLIADSLLRLSGGPTRQAARSRRSRLFVGSWLIALIGYISVAVIVHGKRSTEADLAATIWFQRR